MLDSSTSAPRKAAVQYSGSVTPHIADIDTALPQAHAQAEASTPASGRVILATS